MMLRSQPSKRLRKGSGGPRVTGAAFKALFGAPKGWGAMSKGQGPGRSSETGYSSMCSEPVETSRIIEFQAVKHPHVSLP